MDLAWDPFDTDIDDDPHPTWRRLRDEAPVYRNDKFDFFALSRYADVEAAHRDPRTFSSAQGTVLELMGNDLAATEQMIFLDPPEHTRLRHLVSRAFTPRRVAELEGRVRAMSAGMLDPQLGGDGFDYLQDFGARLPSMVISSLLGVPGEDQETFRHTIDRLFHIEPDIGMVNEVSMTAGIELTRYLAGQLEERLSSRATICSPTSSKQRSPTTTAHETAHTDRRAPRSRSSSSAGHRDRRPTARLGGRDPRRASRPAGRVGCGSGVDPERRRGVAALRGAVTGAGPVDDDRSRTARRGHPDGLEGPAAHRFGRT